MRPKNVNYTVLGEGISERSNNGFLRRSEKFLYRVAQKIVLYYHFCHEFWTKIFFLKMALEYRLRAFDLRVKTLP
jgi:hypothetical protein